MPRNVEVETFWDEKLRNFSARISWSYRFPTDPKDNFVFHVKLADLYKVLKFANNRKLYKWRAEEFSLPAIRVRQMVRFACNLANQLLSFFKSNQRFSMIIPHVGNETELKLEIFAVNQHYCRSESVFKVFNATDNPGQTRHSLLKKGPLISDPISYCRLSDGAETQAIITDHNI